MSTKQSKGKIAKEKIQFQETNLLLALENVVLAMESKGLDENTIFGLTNCILKGFVRNGQFTAEYMATVEQVIKERELTPERLAEMQEAERLAELRAAFGGSTVASH